MILKYALQNRTKIRDIHPGKCFRYLNHVYIRIADLPVHNIEYAGIDLESGAMMIFDREDIVDPMHAEVLLEEGE